MNGRGPRISNGKEGTPPPMSPEWAQHREMHPNLPGRHREEAVCGVDT